MSLEYQIGQVVYSKSGHDQGDVQMICAIEGEYLLLADGRRRKLEKPKRKKKKHVQPTFYVEKDVAAKLQTGEYLLDADIKKALKVARVKGRIEMIKVSDDFTLMIDYAHNAMALESLLDTLRDYHPERIVTVFGCGGNRSKTRRYEMGEVSGKLSDFTIITSDNPRFEEPQAIIDDIVVGMKKTDGKYITICDRKEAIKYAIEHGRPGDVIILAGKGHETYQEIKGVKYDMDERVLIKEVLEELKK